MLGQKLLQKGERALHFEKLQEIPFCQKTDWCPVFFAKKKHWSENDMLENDIVSEIRGNLFQPSKKTLKQIHSSKLYLCVSINKVEARWPGELQLELQQWERKAAGRDRDPFQFPWAFTMLIHPPFLNTNIYQEHWFITSTDNIYQFDKLAIHWHHDAIDHPSDIKPLKYSSLWHF